MRDGRRGQWKSGDADHFLLGATYHDGYDTIGDSIAPNATYTYIWTVPERSGPGPSDGNSVLWSYHSHVSESKDVYAGLMGPIVVYKPGTLGENGLPNGIDREYFVFLLVVDENQRCVGVL